MTDLPELVGFFSYSREDDADSHGELSALRNRIQGELRGQLGRTAKTFRLWQDKEAIPSGTLWETEIKNAVAQAVFFVPIITPTVMASPYCKFELESFLAREAALGRSDLIFPILYIDVPALQDSVLRQNDPVLTFIAKRQYNDWREFRYLDVNSTEVKKAIARFCTHIRDALQRPWLSPDERKQQEEAGAQRRAEAERDIQAKGRAEEEKRQRAAEQERLRREAEAQERRQVEEEEKRRREVETQAEAERKRTEQQRLRHEAEAKHRAADEQRPAEREERRRLLLAAGSLIGVTVLGVLGVRLVRAPPTPVAPPAPSATDSAGPALTRVAPAPTPPPGPVEPRRVRVRLILVATEGEASAIIEQLKRGADFATLAKQKSKDPSAANGGDLGLYLTKEQMTPEFAEVAFKMYPGQISMPFKTQFGWNIIEVEASIGPL